MSFFTFRLQKKTAPIFSGPSVKLKHPGARSRQGRNPTAEGSREFVRDSGNAEQHPLSPAALGLSCAATSRHCASLQRLEKSAPSKKSHYNLRPFYNLRMSAVTFTPLVRLRSSRRTNVASTVEPSKWN